MSGNPPSIVLLPSSSSTSPNSSLQTVTAHPIVRPPIILHQQTLQPSSIPFKSVIVKPYRDSIQQALTTTATNVDIKPIVLQQVRFLIGYYCCFLINLFRVIMWNHINQINELLLIQLI